MVENDEHGPSHEEVLGLTTEIVSAYVSNNTMTPDSVSAFIQQIYKTLREMDETAVKSADRPQPAVPVKKSVTPDHIICLEDGKKLKMLKRHLKAAYGMSPEEYRERWDLPADYPMVAPNYAQRRSKLAKDIGLGTRR
ncbi:MAG: MucR family transcriptional regulator [Alphaproteobacteria bacterium]|nr:MucR family transcriptional regulator [Alphaproteobacteria bacterium]